MTRTKPATERDVDRLSRAIATNMGARRELELLTRQLDEMRMAYKDSGSRSYLTVSTIIQMVAERLEHLREEGERQDILFFSWLEETCASMRN